MYAPFVAIVSMTGVRVLNHSSGTQKRRETRDAYLVSGILMVLADAVSSMVTYRGRFAFRRNRSFDVTSSVNMRHERMKYSSGDDVELFSSPVKQGDLPRP